MGERFELFEVDGPPIIAGGVKAGKAACQPDDVLMPGADHVARFTRRLRAGVLP